MEKTAPIDSPEEKIMSDHSQHFLEKYGLSIVLLVILTMVSIGYFFGMQHKKPKASQETVFLSPTIPVVTVTESPYEMEGTEIMRYGMIQPMHLGNFVFNPTKDYLYPVVPLSLAPLQISVSKIIAADPDQCTKINNVTNWGSYRYLPNVKPGFSPSFGITTWNEKEVTFIDDAGADHPEHKAKYQEYIKELGLLSQYTDQQKLYQEVFQDNSQFSLSPGLVGCGGGWSYPLFISKVDQNTFDEVYYVEKNVGNGDIEKPPRRSLYIRDGDDWLLVGEDIHYEMQNKETVDFSACYDTERIQNGRRTKLECVEKIWSEKYRSESENQAWIISILGMISKE